MRNPRECVLRNGTCCCLVYAKGKGSRAPRWKRSVKMNRKRMVSVAQKKYAKEAYFRIITA